ncbi:ligase-associated DNA damage response endonuclease PdeM [Parerythrobacter jejuensis]|uniref:Ligase-associated DNA damage response endonuclease PdeM n=1 Tax=Parerythrobacter jejuensis TaxID=795812 RepID=A0A845AUP9_9SPHN|nr:ligase-associated DNA damage response endonuclease PdeM [Parerythrobacter jejuensis]MXP30267.1 ligase-associated DNA damage response endonuclease PdeM [Parerythrobacter jejuensis]MXP33027.1 ligase-associated DNA damage response endonuclease PdeM [Parerythrobacter jejuensis]
MVPVSFAGQEMFLTQSNALYWPAEQALLVADLHLEKASFYARHGQMLPPYDSRETLERVADAVKLTGARRVITLGDNFHDVEGTASLEPHAAGVLEALTRSLDWIWITGNHDETMHRTYGGDMAEELEVSGIVLRHQARRGETRPELSGHYHPKMRVRVRQRHISRPCAVRAISDGADRMILPAFGTLTGGMDAGDPEILKVLQPARAIDALVPVRTRLSSFPLWRAEDTRVA